VSSVLVDSKRGEMDRPRRGSNPARQNLEEKTTAVRAEIFAPPHAVSENTRIGQLTPRASGSSPQLSAIGYSLPSPVFFPQILNPILGLGRLPGGTSHEIIGQITAAVPVDLGPEPLQ
jgi:hypothetical protein